MEPFGASSARRVEAPRCERSKAPLTATSLLASLALASAVAAALRLAPPAGPTALSATFQQGSQQDAKFELAAVHGRAARQPSTLGKTLRGFYAWQGQLYLGYGDYGDNTGPIAVSRYEPASGTIVEQWVSDTESIDQFREIRGKLYAPAIDRRRNADYAVGEPWTDVATINTTHAYDMLTLDGADLWLVGSQGSFAAAWRSLDEGETWKRSLRLPRASENENDFARFYFAGALDEKLYVQASDFYGGPHAASSVFDGSDWAEGPDLLASMDSGWGPVNWRGHLIYLARTGRGRLYAFDGQVARYLAGWSVSAIALAEDGLYAVVNSGLSDGDNPMAARIVRSEDLRSWELLETPLPEGADRGIGLLDGTLYVGGLEAQLFALKGRPAWSPVSATFVELPKLRIVYPEEGATFIAPATIPLVAEAAGLPPLVLRVWRGSERVAELAPPFIGTWRDVVTGSHRLGFRLGTGDGAIEDRSVNFKVVEGENGAPVVSDLRAQPAAARPGEPVALTVEAVDPDDDPLRVFWDFGDGSMGEGARVTHVYAESGRFTASVHVTDQRGGYATAGVEVMVGRGFACFMPFVTKGH